MDIWFEFISGSVCSGEIRGGGGGGGKKKKKKKREKEKKKI